MSTEMNIFLTENHNLEQNFSRLIHSMIYSFRYMFLVSILCSTGIIMVSFHKRLLCNAFTLSFLCIYHLNASYLLFKYSVLMTCSRSNMLHQWSLTCSLCTQVLLKVGTEFEKLVYQDRIIVVLLKSQCVKQTEKYSNHTD